MYQLEKKKKKQKNKKKTDFSIPASHFWRKKKSRQEIISRSAVETEVTVRG